jgi:hypothetical protein
MTFAAERKAALLAEVGRHLQAQEAAAFRRPVADRLEPIGHQHPSNFHLSFIRYLFFSRRVFFSSDFSVPIFFLRACASLEAVLEKYVGTELKFVA